ncbi:MULTISPECIES: hypothetical protein [Streptomyces]|uniref:hypothetical protein n=1 Tax=Streptomyces lycopersici TaxID=2974589 RepID=UPI0021D3865F|nr:hypothetical protein [Streptomyces sp. NEAU-383]
MDVRDDVTQAPIPATAVTGPAPAAVPRRLRIITVVSPDVDAVLVDMKPRPTFYGATS